MDPNSNNPANPNSTPPTDPLSVANPAVPADNSNAQPAVPSMAESSQPTMDSVVPPAAPPVGAADFGSIPATASVPSFDSTSFTAPQPETAAPAIDGTAAPADNNTASWGSPTPAAGPDLTAVSPSGQSSFSPAPASDAPANPFASPTEPTPPAAADAFATAPTSSMDNSGGATDPMASWSSPADSSTAPASAPNDSIPTDLSHLAAPAGSEGGMVPSSSLPSDSMVVPAPAPEATVNNTSSGFPKWLLIVGGVILILVIGASAYFILGGGKFGQAATVSVPAEQPPLANPPQPIIPTEAPTGENAASQGGFGSLNGTEATPSSAASTSSAKTPSAMDLLKQRQTPTPTPVQ